MAALHPRPIRLAAPARLAPRPNLDDGRASPRPAPTRAPALAGFTAPVPTRYPAMTPAPTARPIANRRLQDEVRCITMRHCGANRNRFRRFSARVAAPRLRLAGAARLRRGAPYCWREARLALMGDPGCRKGVCPPGTTLPRAPAPRPRGSASQPDPTVTRPLAVRPGPIPRVSPRLPSGRTRFAHHDPVA